MADQGPAEAQAGLETTEQAQHVDANQYTAMRTAVAEVMDIADVTYTAEGGSMRIRGRLKLPAEEAFTRLRPRFEAVGHTPRLTHLQEENMDAVFALPAVFGKEKHGIAWGPLLALIVTIIVVFVVGMGKSDGLYLPPLIVLQAQVTGNLNAIPEPFQELIPTQAQWRQALFDGFLYTIALMGILGSHEMGHYIMARRYKVDTTPPFFIPFPNILGTMGAFIAMREPAPNRKIQFDIGVAGPLAGLIVAVPVLIIGLLLSEVGTPEQILADRPPQLSENTAFLQEGNSILYLLAKLAVFGQILPRDGVDVWIHPVAFAGWAGLLVTALNLMPVGQLDGGHVVYGLLGDRAQKLRTPLLVILGILGAIGLANDMEWINVPFGWSGWWAWIVLILVLVRGHAPVLDDITELDPPRRALAVATMIIFVLIFTPRPIVIVPAALLGLF